MPQLKFRKEALQSTFPAEQYADLVRVTTTKHWVWLAIIYLFLFCFIAWGLFGSIPTRVVGQGILLSNNGVIEDVIMPIGSGRVNAITIKIGDSVKPGQVIAQLENQDVSNKIQVAQSYAQQLNKQYDTLKQNADKAIEDRQNSFQTQKEMFDVSFKIEQEHLEKVTDLLHVKTEMEKKGLVNKDQLLDAYNLYYSVKSKLDQLQDQHIQDKNDLERFIQDYATQLRALSLNIAQAERELDNLIAERDSVKEIKSTVSGVVTHLDVAVGDDISEGKPIISVASEGVGLDAIIFLPAQQGQRIKIGDEVLVSPTIVKKAEYGSMIGKVTQVGHFPSTKESILAVLHNSNLVDEYFKMGSLIAVRVQIKKNPNNDSEYAWTTMSSPEIKMVPGMLVAALVTVKSQAPFSLIIPYYRHAMYGDDL